MKEGLLFLPELKVQLKRNYFTMVDQIKWRIISIVYFIVYCFIVLLFNWGFGVGFFENSFLVKKQEKSLWNKKGQNKQFACNFHNEGLLY